ncbi:MAG: hypothetical protein LBT42_00035, partial [Tannerella sp.]|nr:hypothetical protein [Tannerella sp.]
MKKLSLFIVMTLMSVLWLTSCLEGSNVEQNVTIGVLDYGNTFEPVLKTNGGNVYSPNLNTLIALQEMEIGGCYYFQYSLDRDLPENSANAVTANGYFTVTLLSNPQKIPQYYLSSYLTDTASVLPDEIAVLSGCDGMDYVERRLIMQHTVSHPSDFELNWSLSYDHSTMMPTEDNGQRYYDLFLRATVSKRGDKTVASENTPVNAYNIDNYFEDVAYREKNLLGSSYNSSTSKFNLRINYAAEIDDNQNIIWKSVIKDIFIVQFLQS